ncbi:hypothetical protein [Nonomuraea helvata]|uniref:DUF1273 family protein n=1 Tax=Nonomuraea helvata TaxID=37484 RepID=A0ABV5RTR5_9ACTN
MRVLIVSGHLVDRPGREPPRFPQHLVGEVTAEMSAVFQEWDIGPGTAVFCGGARGADLIGAELALRRGASVHLFLALPPKEFVRSSVDLPGTTWRARFEELRRHANVRSLPAGAASGDEVFARTNAWMVEEALELDPEPRAVVVWDGKAGDGPGGTSDLVSRLRRGPGDPRVRIIDPTALVPR